MPKENERSNLINAFLELEFMKEVFFDLWAMSENNKIATIHAEMFDVIVPSFQERFDKAKAAYRKAVLNPCRPQQLYSVNQNDKSNINRRGG